MSTMRQMCTIANPADILIYRSTPPTELAPAENSCQMIAAINLLYPSLAERKDKSVQL